jgi:aminoglycoside phosphotransferase (APT) family kinase protein
MSDANSLDAAVLGPYLARHVPGFGSLTEITKFNTGQSNPTYLIRSTGGKFVLRAKPPGELLKSAHAVDREYKVMKALEQTPVPVPRMLHLTGDDSPIGRQFLVMEFLDGRIFWDPALARACDEQAERAAIYDAMNQTLADMHNVDLDAVGLADYGKPGNYFERQLGRWSSQYKASETGTIEAMDRLMAWLEQAVPADDGMVSLVHGDYRLDNVMIAKDSEKIIAVLDWELSTLGHPFADLAYQCMQWRLPNDSGFRGLAASTGRQSDCRPNAIMSTPIAAAGASPIDNWTFYLAFSFFRLAAILQGVYKRALDGNASNPERGKTFGAAVKLIAGQAVDLIEQGD